MITVDETRELPTEWTDTQIQELFDHARDLGHNGNPAGWLFTARVRRYLATSNQYGVFLRLRSKWDYDGLRRYIADHPEEIKRIWQFRVLPDPRY